MREILFRGQDAESGEWVYGYYVHFKTMRKVVHAIYTGCADGCSEGLLAHCYDVKPETVGQYTGLRDKNGVKIFEGDVVMKRTYHKKKPCEVVFGVGCFHCGWGGGSSTADHPYLLNDKRIEVIGNKFDNLELLKGSAKNE